MKLLAKYRFNELDSRIQSLEQNIITNQKVLAATHDTWKWFFSNLKMKFMKNSINATYLPIRIGTLCAQIDEIWETISHILKWNPTEIWWIVKKRWYYLQKNWNDCYQYSRTYQKYQKSNWICYNKSANVESETKTVPSDSHIHHQSSTPSHLNQITLYVDAKKKNNVNLPTNYDHFSSTTVIITRPLHTYTNETTLL